MRTKDSQTGAKVARRFEPMLLLVIGIPLLTVIGGIFTIYLAFNGPHESAIAKPEPNFKGVPLR